MNLLENLLQTQSGDGAMAQLARQFGLDDGAAQSVLRQLVPALTQGVKKNAASADGLSKLAGALASGNHERYLSADTLKQPETVDDGNAILGHIFGSKDVSRGVAQRASASTGVDAGVIKKMLPLVAAAMMGSMSKATGKGRALNPAAEPSGGMPGGGLLGKLLDSDGDGSIMDDVAGLARKLF